jgi:putative nucleotidyltransferase with HDIG domain
MTSIPTKEECMAILTNNKTPSNIIDHCKTVCKVAEEVADKLINKGTEVNKSLVIAAAMLHDIERTKDNHVVEGTKLIKSMGFPEVAEVVKKHGLYKLEDEDIKPRTTEEKIVFYADKRSKGNEVVTLKERIEDLKKRYNKDFKEEFKFAEKIEEELT